MPRHVRSRGKQSHRASTVAQQLRSNTSEDCDSRQGSLGLVTDLFFCVKRQGFIRVSLHGDEFDRHPWDSTERGLQSSPWQVYHHCYVSQKSVTASY